MSAERTDFIEACFAADLQAHYRGLLARDIRYSEAIEDVGGVLRHRRWSPSGICCASGEVLSRENLGIKVGYWTPMLWKPCRKDLVREYQRREAYDCQLIDTNCNDCKHLVRGGGGSGVFVGRCALKDVAITFMPNACMSENSECFEHIRTIER